MQISWQLPVSFRQILESWSDNDGMGLLASENGKNHSHRKTTSRQGRRLWKSVGVIGLLLSLGAFMSSKRLSADLNTVKVKSPSSTPQEDYWLHVLLPTRMHPIETCRTVLSSTSLNYPIPWAISWHADVDSNGKDIANDLGKIKSILAFLEIQEEPARDNDTVIVLGNQRPWFQVRPQVLLQRYRSIQQEPQGLRQNASRELWESQHSKRKIVLSVEKTCVSRKGLDCFPVQAEDNTLRFISHNIAIGPVYELRKLYRDAVAEAEALQTSKDAFDEHSIFARLVRTQQHVNSAPRDYSIALDYDDRLSFAATSDASYTPKLQTISGLGSWFQTSPAKLTEDIIHSEPPFQTLSGEPALHKAWSDVSLLIPQKAATVPAIVQQSAEFDPSLTQEWYERLWFHPHGRKLLDLYTGNPKIAVASFVDSDGVQQRFYTPHAEKAGAMAANNEFHPWSEICGSQEFTGDIFLDGFG